MQRDLDEIWQEYLDSGELSSATTKELAWHIDEGPNPLEAMSIAADIGLVHLAPNIARQLNHASEWNRERAVGCLLGRLELPEFAAQGLKMAREDKSSSVRSLATFNIGEVLNKITDHTLQNQVAKYLYDTLSGGKKTGLPVRKGSAYYSILAALDVPVLDRPEVWELDESIDPEIVEKFRKKFNLDKPAKGKS